MDCQLCGFTTDKERPLCDFCFKDKCPYCFGEGVTWSSGGWNCSQGCIFKTSELINCIQYFSVRNDSYIEALARGGGTVEVIIPYGTSDIKVKDEYSPPNPGNVLLLHYTSDKRRLLNEGFSFDDYKVSLVSDSVRDGAVFAWPFESEYVESNIEGSWDEHVYLEVNREDVVVSSYDLLNLVISEKIFNFQFDEYDSFLTYHVSVLESACRELNRPFPYSSLLWSTD